MSPKQLRLTSVQVGMVWGWARVEQLHNTPDFSAVQGISYPTVCPIHTQMLLEDQRETKMASTLLTYIRNFIPQ